MTFSGLITINIKLRQHSASVHVMDPRVLSAIHGALSTARPELAQLSQVLWSNPELGLQEHGAHDALTDFLEQHGFVVERHAVLPTGFVASHTTRSSRPHVVLLAEFDALPDIGHACGHNLIAAASVGAGLAVRAALEATDLPGRVSVFGTPAEESDGGKIHFLKVGRFQEVDAALMSHPVGGKESIVKPMLHSSANYVVTFAGRAAHAAANPWHGVNALDAAVTAYQNVAIRRQQFRPEWRVAGIITRGGTATNVVPDSTELRFNLRATSKEDALQLGEIWRQCMEAAAVATGCSVEVKDVRPPYLPLNSNVALADVFKKNAESLGVEFIDEKFYGGSTDMGNVSHEVPSIHPLFQINSASQIHQRDFAKDTGGEGAMEFVMQQARLLAMTAVDVLKDAQLREAMWKELQERRE